MVYPASSVIAETEANLAGQARALASRSPRVTLHHEPDLLRISSEIAHPYLNRVFVARFLPPEVERRIGEVLDGYLSRAVPLSWMVGPSSSPSDLGDYLVRAGLIRGADEGGMALDLSLLPDGVPPPGELAIEPVDDAESLRHWLEIVTTAFGLPDSVGSVLYGAYARALGAGDGPWRFLVGLLEGQPVGASRVCGQGSVAGVYHVAVLPFARGRGVGTAMTLAALREAQRSGCRLAVLRAVEAGQGIYRRLGFREYCRFGWYSWPGEGQKR